MECKPQYKLTVKDGFYKDEPTDADHLPDGEYNLYAAKVHRGFEPSIFEIAQATGADIDGGMDADLTTGFPGEAASITFTEKQLEAFVAAVLVSCK